MTVKFFSIYRYEDLKMKKDKRQKSDGMLKGLIKTSGGVVNRAIDKGGDLAAAMMDQTAALISKLSDDIGVMADRILTMEERIGFMADRIVKTEELMAKLTAALANKELQLPRGGLAAHGPSPTPLLSLEPAEASRASLPDLRISGDPSVYLLLVSTSPEFPEGSTVVSKVETPEDLRIAWRRSLSAIIKVSDDAKAVEPEPISVSVAVKTVGGGQRVSLPSNSIDLTISD
jgi:hypothetical protein